MGPATILLVDDDEDTCASMSDVFVDFGYGVDVAYDGPAALELCRRNRYRLALLDYRMPGMDGLELCRLRGHQPGVVVALVTAFASAATTDATAEAGVRRIIPKPVDFPVLIRLVEDVVVGLGR
jgi:CheY-like chemotaxis protein